MPEAVETLGKVVDLGEIVLGRGQIISAIDIERLPGPYPIYSSSATGSGEFGRYGSYMFDEELITWSVDGGGRPFYRPRHRFSVTNVCGYLRICDASKWNYRYIHALLEQQHARITFDYQLKAHPSVIRNLYSLPRRTLREQRQIAEILDTIDEAIQKTEAIIAKLKQVKQGLLHDLLTRGIDENGDLRDPAAHPGQFKDSALGKIPALWRISNLGSEVTSAVDGPFGSNLKTSHYVDESGVRVVRLQNIGEGMFLDADRAYVSKAHAVTLSKHEVQPGDMLVASLGDERHPFGRACLYPLSQQQGVVKADCFRLRFSTGDAHSFYFMSIMNTYVWRRRLNRLAQGVTRDRVNLGNLLSFEVPVAPLPEQKEISRLLIAHDDRISKETASHKKLVLLKQGLMNDLLTGHVRVTNLLGKAG